MKNELVHQIKNEIYVNSKTIADSLEVTHKDLLRTIEKTISRSEKQCAAQHNTFPPIFKKSTFVNKMNRTFEMYELNESAYLLLAMQLSQYEKAFAVQLAIVESFQLMKRALLNHENASWIETRQATKQIRAVETDTIKDFVEYATKQGSKNAKFYYSNITKMTNKALEMLNQSKIGTPIRDLANIQQLGYIMMLEERASLSIKDGMNQGLDYKHIYSIAKDEVNRLADNLCFRPVISNN